MAVVDRRVAPNPTEFDMDAAWSPTANLSVAELLNHLSEELALEYVHLMERAAKDGRDNESLVQMEA